MILDDAQLVDDQNAMLLSERISSVCLLQMDPQDSLQPVLDVLRQQEKPVFILLPDSGHALSQPEHFIDLRHLLIKEGHPPFLCLVIPSQRTTEVALAAHYGIQSASSMDEALQSLVHTYLPTETDHRYVSPTSLPTIDDRVTEGLQRVKMPPLQQSPSFARKRPYLLSVGIIGLLLAASAIFVPFMFFTPTHPQPGAATIPLGTLVFTSSGQFNPSTTQGYNDIITLSLRRTPAPPTGMFYYVWLMPDPNDDTTPPLLIETLHTAGTVNLTYTSPDHTNLLASYSGVRITVQPSNTTPDTPSQNPASWKWQGFIPNIPTPGDENHYSLLSHLRHLLAKDPTLQENQLPGGLAIWLTRNVSKVEEWASAAQGDWHGLQTSDGDADQIHRHMLRIVEYLDGVFYYTLDVPPGSPWLVDPLAGKIGLLNSVQNQNPPGFLAHVDIHLTGLAGAPGHTSQQQQLAILVDTIIRKMRTDLLQVRNDAVRLVKLNTKQLQQQENNTTLNEMAMLTTEVKSGWFDSSTGENIGGVLWITSRFQQLATLPVSLNDQNQDKGVSLTSAV